MPDGSKISTSFVYAPSKDDKEFWEEVMDTVNSSENSNRLIMGDCNVTLDHKDDSMGYLTDPHKQSRAVLKKLIDNESLINIFTHTQYAPWRKILYIQNQGLQKEIKVGPKSGFTLSNVIHCLHGSPCTPIFNHRPLFTTPKT